MRVGIIHPGAMGSVLGAQADADICWASKYRSKATKLRADEAGFEDRKDFDALADGCDVIISVCPPDVAVEIATAVARRGFPGIYVDVNAIAPLTSERIGAMFKRYVDGAIFGPPPTRPGATRMYLCGDESETVAALWGNSSHLDTKLLDREIGAASALKMAYAGWTKGSAALLLATRAYAESQGVEAELHAEWDASIPGLTDRIERRATGTGSKAWRFAGEMEEIAKALESTDLPPGFHEAAAEIYIRISDLRDVDHPTLAEVMAHLVGDEIG